MRLNSFTDKNEEALLNPNARIRAEFVFSLLWQNRLISICAFFSALMIALCDLLSIALIVPLIDSLRGGDKASEMLKLYPNPGYDVIYVEYSSGEFTNTTLELTDLSGKVVMEVEVDQLKTPIDVSSLTRGVYFLTGKKEGIILSSQKLTLQ